MLLPTRTLCTRLAGHRTTRRAQRQIRFRLRRCRNTTSPPRLVNFIYHHNTIAATSRAPPLRARFVAASRALRVLRRVVRQVRRPVARHVLLPLYRLSVQCAIRVCTQTQ